MAIDGIRQGMAPNIFAQQYANQHGIENIEDAKTELKSLYGDPTQSGNSAVSDALSSGNVDGSGNSSSLPPEAMQLHDVYGIPLETIMQGDDAIRQYAEENGINIPAKTTGGNIDYNS